MTCFKRLKDYVTQITLRYSGHQWIIFFVFCFAYLSTGCVASLQAPFYPAESERKGASSTEYGLVFGIFNLVVFLSSPLFGKYMNHLGAKGVFHWGLLTIGVSCFMFGFLAKINDHATFIALSFVIRIIEAVGSSATCTGAFTIIAAEFPDSVGTTFVRASLETFYGVGLVIGPSMGGFLYGIGGFILPFLVSGLGLILVACIIPFLMPTGSSMGGGSGEDCRDNEGFSLLTLLKIPAAAISAITIWTSSNSIGFISATLEPHLRQFQFSELQVGLIFMSSGASYAISAPLWGKLMDKSVHPQYVSLCGCALLIIAHLMIGPAIFIPMPTELSVSLIGLIIHGVGVGAVQVSAFILVLRESIAEGFPDNLTTYSVVSGLWASFLALGLFVGPCAGGFLLDLTNFRMGSLYPLCTAIIALVFVIGFIIQNKKSRRSLYRMIRSQSANLLYDGNSSSLSGGSKRVPQDCGTSYLEPTFINYGSTTA